MRRLLFTLGLAGLGWAAPGLEVKKSAPSVGTISGGVLADSQTLYTWGSDLRLWHLPSLTSKVLARGNFSGGGCVVDLDNDGSREIVSQEGPGLGKLVWRKGPSWVPVIVDSEVEMPDCLSATLFGRRGFLTIHRFAQIRFYQMPKKSGDPWPYREIYSIYTPSQQAGLALYDIDGDGLLDIYCGNYWIKSPTRFDLPWRLFAINTYSEEHSSAKLRIQKIGLDQVVGQMDQSPGRLTWFEKPSDPQRMWIDHRLSDSIGNAGGLALADLDADGLSEVIVGERDGPRSRLRVFWNGGNYRFRESVVASQSEFLGLWKLGRKALISIHPDQIKLWGLRK